MTNSTQTRTADQKLTIEQRFNLAIEGIKNAGIEVILNPEDDRAYTNTRSENGAIWTDPFENLAFDGDGNPVLGEDDYFSERKA